MPNINAVLGQMEPQMNPTKLEPISQEEEFMSLSTRRRFFISLVLPFTMSACAKQPASEQVAKKFMEAYYVRIDLKGADQLSMGLAKEKLDHQIQLLDGQGLGKSADIPNVDINLVSTPSNTPDETTFIYQVIPHVADVGKRSVFVKLRKEDGQWKVSQFIENFPGLNPAPSNPSATPPAVP